MLTKLIVTLSVATFFGALFYVFIVGAKTESDGEVESNLNNED